MVWEDYQPSPSEEIRRAKESVEIRGDELSRRKIERDVQKQFWQ